MVEKPWQDEWRVLPQFWLTYGASTTWTDSDPLLRPGVLADGACVGRGPLKMGKRRSAEERERENERRRMKKKMAVKGGWAPHGKC